MDAFEPFRAQAGRQHGLLTRAQLTAGGIASASIQRAVQRGRLRRMGRSVYLLGEREITYEAVAMAAVLRCGPDSYVSHRSALALHGLTPATVDSAGLAGPPIEILRLAARVSTVGVEVRRTRQLQRDGVTRVSGVPLTTVARTLCDLALDTSHNVVLRWAAEACRRRKCSPDAIGRVAGSMGRGTVGVARVRALADALRDSAPDVSALESLAREVFAAAELVGARWERTVSADEAGWIGRVDCSFDGPRVVVEFDSHLWHGQITDAHADALRDRRLAGAGWVVLRFGWFDLRHRPEQVVAQVRAVLAGRKAA